MEEDFNNVSPKKSPVKAGKEKKHRKPSEHANEELKVVKLYSVGTIAQKFSIFDHSSEAMMMKINQWGSYEQDLQSVHSEEQED